ncbi:HAD family hydrolase [Tepidibacter mesophilus]|uniref:HAD family hydrolase n=1 Tax=Tepidibacter mesophilus TaxID=655607 RepID=UPI000C069D94|nr:HAD-IB family hydrolase [Tepidibacter mesophilus]
MKKTAAFFDIDGTLYRDSLMVEHFKKLIKYDLVDPSVWHSHAKQTFLDWDKRQGNYDDYLLELAEIYISSIKGLNKKDIEFTSNQVISLKAERVYRYTRSRIKWHLNEGHIVIFISGSPDFLVEKMANKYNVADCIGSGYIFRDNKFSGDVTPMWDSDSKDKAINDFVQKYNLDLSESYAYGDTNGDFSMLTKVGNPVAINPAKELLCKIQNDAYLSKTAKIIVERKDVIYNLDPSVSVSI